MRHGKVQVLSLQSLALPSWLHQLKVGSQDTPMPQDVPKEEASSIFESQLVTIIIIISQTWAWVAMY